MDQQKEQSTKGDRNRGRVQNENNSRCNDILSEGTVSKEYLIEWDYVDPKTGQVYPD